MKRNTLAICDWESVYVNKLTEYLNQRNVMNFQIEGFTGIETLKEFVHKQIIDVLLISEELLGEGITELEISKIIVIAEEKQAIEPLDYPALYKYQSGDSLLKELLLHCESVGIRLEKFNKVPGNNQIIGIYSPIGRIYKTSLALSLGQLLAKDFKVLYLNMEEYAGLDNLVSEAKGDLSDILYYLEQGKEMHVSLHNMIQSINGLEFIPPVLIPTDISEIQEDIWLRLIQKLIDLTEYEIIILDIGNYVKGLAELLKLCTVILTPYREDLFSDTKLKSFERVLSATGYDCVLENIKKYNFTNLNNKVESIDQILYSEIGEIARNIIKNDLQFARWRKMHDR